MRCSAPRMSPTRLRRSSRLGLHGAWRAGRTPGGVSTWTRSRRRGSGTVTCVRPRPPRAGSNPRATDRSGSSTWSPSGCRTCRCRRRRPPGWRLSRPRHFAGARRGPASLARSRTYRSSRIYSMGCPGWTRRMRGSRVSSRR